jgi:hypothetical protein
VPRRDLAQGATVAPVPDAARTQYASRDVLRAEPLAPEGRIDNTLFIASLATPQRMQEAPAKV